jgi:hypothetical protein
VIDAPFLMLVPRVVVVVALAASSLTMVASFATVWRACAARGSPGRRLRSCRPV